MKKLIFIIFAIVILAVFIIPSYATVPSTVANPTYPLSESPIEFDDTIHYLDWLTPMFNGNFYAYDRGLSNTYGITAIQIPMLNAAMAGIDEGAYDINNNYYQAITSLMSLDTTSQRNALTEYSYIQEYTAVDDRVTLYFVPETYNPRDDNFNPLSYIWCNGDVYCDLVSGMSGVVFKKTDDYQDNIQLEVSLDGVAIYFNDNEVVSVENVNATIIESTQQFEISSYFNSSKPLDSTYVKFSGTISVKCVGGTLSNSSKMLGIGSTYEKTTADIDDGKLTIQDNNTVSAIYKRVSATSTGGSAAGTLTVNSAGTHNVSGYEYINVDIPPYSLYYNGDISNGTYENSTKWNGVDISILMDIGNTFERGKTTTITRNGEYDIGRSQFVNVECPQEVIEDINAFNWFFGAVNGVLTMELMPGFSLGGILLFIAGLALLVWILKIFLGG